MKFNNSERETGIMKNILAGLIDRLTGITALMIFSVAMLLLCAGAENANSAPPAPGTVKWNSGLIAGNNFDSPAAIGANGRIYVGKQDGYLYAFTPDSGTYQWRISLDSGSDGINSAPAIGQDGTIYVTAADGHLFAVTDNDTTAAIKWQYPDSGADALGGLHGSPAIGQDGTIYVGSDDHNFYAIAPPAAGGTVGNLKWSYAANSNVHSSPAIGADGTIYVVDAYGYLLALQDNGTGYTLKWQYPATNAGGLQASSPAIGPDGTLYVGGTVIDVDAGTRTPTLYAIKPNGSQKWRYSMSGYGIDYQSPVIAPDGTIYLGTGGDGTHPGYLYALTASGTKKWQYEIRPGELNGPYGIDDTPAIDSNGVIYFGASDGWAYAITDGGTTATLKWRCLVNTDYGGGAWATGSIPSSPAIGPDGTIYIGSAGEDVFYAIYGDSSGPATSAWPLFHHDSQRTGQSLADLTVTAVSDPPSIVMLGLTLTARDTVTNQGLTGPANAASATRYYLSASGVKDPGSLLLGSRSVPPVPTAGSSSGTASLTVPAGVAPGDYYLIACADDTGVIRETDEENNCKSSATTTTVTAPDLAVLSVEIPPLLAVELGGKLTFTETVKNQGNAKAAASVTRYYMSISGVKDADAVLVGKRSLPALAAQASSSRKVTVPVPVGVPMGPDGKSYLLACADDTGKIAESDETNNCTATTEISLIPPDLTDTLVGNPPANAALGGKISVTDIVTNTGPVKAAASVTHYYLSTSGDKNGGEILIGKRSVPGLKPLASSRGRVSLTLNSSIPVGDYFLFACADDPGMITEASEDNNCTEPSSIMTIVAPDLITDVTNTEMSESTHSFTITDTVTNRGPVQSAPSLTRYYLTPGVNKVSAFRVGSRSIPALAANGTTAQKVTRVTVAKNGKIPKDIYSVIACTNDDGKAKNGLNNCSISPVKIDCTSCHTDIPNKIYMYATSALYDGNLKGTQPEARTGADAIALANLPAALAGKTAHAFISISAVDSIAKMPGRFGFPKGAPIVSATDGTTIIGNNWADLLDGDINIGLGAALTMPDTHWWWSGSSDSGAFDPVNNCNGWTSNLASDKGKVGNKNVIGPAWIDDSPFNGDGSYYLIGIAY